MSSASARGRRAACRAVKACCADAYAKDVVALLLGDSYHPGGTALPRRLADRLQLTAGGRVLDVASGRGTTALLLADAYGVRVDGVDYSAANTALARGSAQAAGLAQRAVFSTGDAEHLPYSDEVFDAVVCECALCTFPDKVQAAAEFARVLRPGGRVGITDVTAVPDRLPPELTGLGARMIDQIEARMNLLRLTAPARLADAGVDLTAAPAVLAAARAGGALLLLVGAYVAHYGWYEIRVQNNPATQDPVIDAAGTIQRTLADTLDTISPGAIAAVLAALLIGGVVLRRRRPGTPSQPPADPGNAPAP